MKAKIHDYVRSTYRAGSGMQQDDGGMPGDVASTIWQKTRIAGWRGFLANNSTVLTSETAKLAFKACFNGADPGGPEWDRYLKDHKYGKYL